MIGQCFHVTAGNVKFAVNKWPSSPSHPFVFFVGNATISR